MFSLPESATSFLYFLTLVPASQLAYQHQTNIFIYFQLDTQDPRETTTATTRVSKL